MEANGPFEAVRGHPAADFRRPYGAVRGHPACATLNPNPELQTTDDPDGTDMQGIVAIGTFTLGVTAYSRMDRSKRRYLSNPSNPQSIPSPVSG